MRQKIIVTLAVWGMLVGGSLLWNLFAAQATRHEVALQTAKNLVQLIVVTRSWNAGHGGIYVPVSASTQPNPYLDPAGRDIPVNKTLSLTKINPAYMTRQISELAAQQNGSQFHLTSLRPIRPENRPSPRERRALEAFERGQREAQEFLPAGEGEAFFYMAPLITEKACLRCHAQQGYREGDIRGGLSVTLPFVHPIPLVSLALGHLLLGLAGVWGILFAGARLQSYTEQLQRQSVTDALTGIPNRRSFSETILREFRRAKRDNAPLSVIMCDIDWFKDYNDSYGHTAGDQCLKEVSQGIAEALNRAGDFCARYGGEEFVVILPKTAAKDACGIAEKIRATVQGLALKHERALPWQLVTLSLGVATMESKSSLSDAELIKRADDALYQAKAAGRNRVVPWQGRG